MQVFSSMGGELHVPEWGPLFTLPLCPFTLGGDGFHLTRAVQLADAHLDQQDQTLNAKLWGLFPWDDIDTTKGILTARFKKSEREDTEKSQMLLHGTYATFGAKMKACAPPHERARLGWNMTYLDVLVDTLHVHGFLDSPTPTAMGKVEAAKWRAIFTNSGGKGKNANTTLPDNYGQGWVHPRDRKRNKAVEPIKSVVKRVQEKKDIVTKALFDTGNYIAAAREYCKLLLELYPWAATPLIFTNQQAFSTGIAQLESDLWAKLGLTTIKIGRLTDYNEWYAHALDCGEAILNARYTTRNALSRAAFILHEVYGRMHTKSPLGLGQVPNMHQCPAVMCINSYILGHSYAVGDKGDGAWAHKNCHETHACNDKTQHHGSEVLDTKLPKAIMMPRGPNGPLVLKTDFSVND